MLALKAKMTNATGFGYVVMIYIDVGGYSNSRDRKRRTRSLCIYI